MAFTVISLNKHGEVITDEYIKNLKCPELQEILTEVWSRIQREQEEKEKNQPKMTMIDG